MSGLKVLRRQLARPVDAWTAFWFTPQDPLSLGVCRLLVGTMMVYSHLVWGLNLEGFFGPDGWQSQEAMQSFFAEDWLPSLWWHVPVEHLHAVHLLCVVPLAMFALGILTPVSSVLALVVTISNSNRAPLANYGMDQFLVMLALYLTIGGSGARFSVDEWWRRRTASRSAACRRPPATSRARLATRLIQVHYCVIYFFAGMSKLQGDAWWTGDAVWLAFANLEYQSIDMTWLARYPWMTQIATHTTVLWELSFPFVVWNRSLRPLVLAMGVAMHAGIGVFMGMITFGLIAIFGYLAFVPPEVLQRIPGLFSTRSTEQPQSPSEGAHSEETTDPGPFPVLTAQTFGPVNLSAAGSLDEHRVHPSREQARPMETTPAAEADNAADWRVGVCDPGWKYRAFSHYLSRRGYSPCVTASPLKLWSHVESDALSAAVVFADRLDTREYALLLDDLSLSPIWQLPLVIASRKRSRLDRAQMIQCPRLATVELPSSCREIRAALDEVLHRPFTSADVADDVAPSQNGHAAAPQLADPDEYVADSPSQHVSGKPR